MIINPVFAANKTCLAHIGNGQVPDDPYCIQPSPSVTIMISISEAIMFHHSICPSLSGQFLRGDYNPASNCTIMAPPHPNQYITSWRAAEKEFCWVTARCSFLLCSIPGSMCKLTDGRLGDVFKKRHYFLRGRA